jgi:hypothetical protein
MEGLDLTQTVPVMSVSVMGVLLILLPLIQLLVYLFIRHGYPQGYKGIFLGMASYFIICNVILSLVYLAEQWIGAQFLQGQTDENMIKIYKNVGQVLSLLIECTLLVECLEFAYRKFSYQPGSSTYGNTMAFALGFSLIESLQWVMSMLSNWIMSIGINNMGLEAYNESLTAEEMESFMKSIEKLLNYGPLYYILIFVERVLFAAFIFAIISMVQLVSRKIVQRTLMFAIIGIYFCYYLPALLRNSGVIGSDVLTIVLVLIVTVLVDIFSWQLMKKRTPEETDYLSALKAEGIFTVILRFKKKKTEQKQDLHIHQNANTGR